MLGVRWIVFALGCLMMQPVVQAKTIAVDGDEPRKSITVTIEDVNMDRVLKDFGQIFGFEIRRLKNVRRGGALSATMSGSLEDILGRLLRNWNHMIVRSPDNHSGIEKVMILDSTYGSLPLKARSRRPSRRLRRSPSNAKRKQKQSSRQLTSTSR